MRLTLLKNIKRFYRHPKYIQWISAVILFALFSVFTYYLIESVYLPILIAIIPFAKPIGHFLLVPFLRLAGLLKYYSPMFIAVKLKEKRLEIHNGSSFDYLVNMRWKQRGLRAKKRMMIYYLKGFLKIIDELEKQKLPRDVTLTGTSYFFSNKSAIRIGFIEKKVSTIERMLFFLDYINLFLMYSYSNGRICFPDIARLKKVEISGEKLLQSKEKIITLLILITKRKSVGISAAL